MSAKKSSTTSKSSWLDETSSTPVIEAEARRLDTFLQAVADGNVDSAELKQQEQRLVALMKEVEPLLEGDLHAKVTQLLCELTAYNLMQVMNSMYESRPKTKFRG